MSSKDQDTSLDNDAQGREGQQSLYDHGNSPPDAEMTPLNPLELAKKESTPATPVLKSVVIGPPSSATISEPVLNRPASQKISTPLDPTLSASRQASGPRDPQLQTHDLQLHQRALQTVDGQGAPISRSLPNKQSIQQSEPPSRGAATSIDQLTAFWEKYNVIGDKEDKEFVASAGGDLDNLLIFAGLFSAIDAAFIIESYKGLKPDPADEATKLLRSVVLLLRDPTYTDESATQPFSATARDVRINCLLFTSLCCSLSAAFGAVLAKQWLTQYDQDGGGSLKTPAARGRERQRKYDGRGKWHLEDVIVTLPTLLQLSLFFFLVGLADFIWPLNTPVAYIIISFTAATFLFYTITIFISVIDRSAPFQTRLSALLARTSALLARAPALLASVSRRLVRGAQKFYGGKLKDKPYWLWPLGAAKHILFYPLIVLPIHSIKHYKSTLATLARTYHSLTSRFRRDKEAGTPKQSVESRCVVHLLERMTLPEDLDMLAEAVELLPDTSGAPQVADALATFHLKPALTGGQWRFPGLYSQSRGAMAKMLEKVLGKWEDSELDSSSIHNTQLLDNALMREALLLQLWDTFLAHPENQEVYASTRQIYLSVSRGERDPTPSSFGQFLSRGSVTANLMAAATQERTFRLVCLLPSIGCASAIDTMKLLRTITPESPQLIDTLQSTMWEAPGHKPDLEVFWLTTFRVEILPSHCLDTLVDSHFPEYLATWFTHFSIPDWKTRFPPTQSHFRRDQSFDQQLSLYWTYLFSLHHLLDHTGSQAWSHKLVATGHLSCLHVILQHYPHDEYFCAEPLGLWAFLCLWNQEESQGGSNTSLFLTNDYVQLVTKSVESCSSRTRWITEMAEVDGLWHLPRTWTSLEKVAQDMVEMLDWLFAYLEAAKRGGLLDEGVAESAIRAYSGWWADVNSLLPEDQKRRDRSDELRMILLGNVST